MDILKKLLNNPAFDHLAENIISFMDTDEAMEAMIESELLSDEERKVMREVLRKLMVKEAQMYCEKEVNVYSHHDYSKPRNFRKVYFKTTLYTMFPFFKDALQELKNSETLESFNLLYDILVWLQPGESRLDVFYDEKTLLCLYFWSDFKNVGLFRHAKGPKDMLEAFKLANEALDVDFEDEDEDEDEVDYDDSDYVWSDEDDYECYHYSSDDSMNFPGNKYDYDSVMQYGLQW